MLGLPLWVWMASPLIGFAVFVFCAHRANTTRYQSIAWKWESRGMVGGAVLVLIGVGFMMVASGREDENRVRAECAKHGMAPFREAFHSQCIDPKTHQLRAFEDVR